MTSLNYIHRARSPYFTKSTNIDACSLEFSSNYSSFRFRSCLGVTIVSCLDIPSFSCRRLSPGYFEIVNRMFWSLDTLDAVAIHRIYLLLTTAVLCGASVVQYALAISPFLTCTFARTKLWDFTKEDDITWCMCLIPWREISLIDETAKLRWSQDKFFAWCRKWCRVEARTASDPNVQSSMAVDSNGGHPPLTSIAFHPAG